ncbi:restriction endonuclease subunit S [Gemmatimonadota bacterium]
MPETLKKITGTTVAFGDVVQLSKERSQDPAADGFERYVGLEHLEPSDLKVRSWGDIADGTTFTNVFRSGQVLFGKRRAYQRKVAVPDFGGVCSGDIYVLEPRDDRLLPELLPFICQSEPFYDYVISMSQGGLSPRVNWKALAKYEVALPPPEEQRRIAGVLLSIEVLNNKLLQVATSCLATLGSCRDTWFGISTSSTSTLGGLCERGAGIQIGPFGAQLHQSDYTPEGVPVVMPSDLGDDSISMDQIARVSPDKADQLGQHRLQVGDIVLPRRGDLDRRALVTEEHKGWLCGTGCLRIRLDDVSLAEAVVQSLSSASVLRWLESRAVGTTMPNLNSKIVAGVPVQIPERVGDALDLVRQLIENLESTRARIAKLTRMRSNLLSEVLR